MWSQYYISDSCIYADHVCEVNYEIPLEDNFDHGRLSREFPMITMVLLSILPILICTWCFTDIATKFWAFDWRVSRSYGICMSIMIIIYYSIMFLVPSKLETCAFPISCHEGINNTIVTTNYYYQMKECPEYDSWLTDDYSELYDYDENCEESEWGCCTMREGIQCSEFSDYTYSYYNTSKDIYSGYWSFHLAKVDKNGSNCPKNYEMIYEVSKNDKPDYILLSILVTIVSVIVLVVVNICQICSKKVEYNQTESDDKVWTIRASA